jgi:hypothetical protein
VTFRVRRGQCAAGAHGTVVLRADGRIGSMQAKIRFEGGPLGGRSVAVPRLPFLLGRGPAADLVIDDPWVSRVHCELAEADGRLVVRDRRSKHGTVVNGQLVTERIVEPGERITVGLTTVVVCYKPCSAAAAAPSAAPLR